jgi:tetratricopeptide (TPR) repeat protein
LLRNNREIVAAHRRYIALSIRLGNEAQVVREYRELAKASPRDKFARYGFGYALTFAVPPRLDEAEEETQAALAIDPRFAAAHLTLGWIREQRERQAPGKSWLEKASSSYEIAWTLLDKNADPELWAAAQLNQGNALLKLDKTDSALAAYRNCATVERIETAPQSKQL